MKLAAAKGMMGLFFCSLLFCACAGGGSGATREEMPFHALENYQEGAGTKVDGDGVSWDRDSLILLEDDLYVCRETGALAGTPEYEARRA